MKLHVNVDHVATLRQARGTRYPDPAFGAGLCEHAGADGITVHLREDRRHIQDHDLGSLRPMVKGILNLEMAATHEMVELALRVRPDVVTLVPEKREERTTEGGLDVGSPATARAVERLRAGGIPVSLFIDPAEAAVRASAALAVPRIELHTGEYCEAHDAAASEAAQREPRARADAELARVRTAAALGAKLGLHVAAGHGLNVTNVGPIAAIPEVEELNIGHAIIARAVFIGLEAAVREMRTAIDAARGRAS